MCENLLSTIRSSGLNFILSETPFSVNIVLKKTFIYRKNASEGSATSLSLNHSITDQSVISKQSMGTNFIKKTILPTNIKCVTSSPKSSNYDPGKCGPIRPNLVKQSPSWKTNRSIKNQKNTSQSATMKSSMKDGPTLSTWHQNSTIPAMQTRAV